ncbi:MULTISPECIES: hypothetical protein [unclassified Streptomyces]|uniref:hypothetical protein n=1 Tax=unclassified Streptomyces TaxID=2593676 RepID=UPI002F90D7C5
MFNYKPLDGGPWKLRVFSVSEDSPAASVEKASELAKRSIPGYQELSREVQGSDDEVGDAERTYNYDVGRHATYFAVDHRFKAVEDGNLYAVVVYGPADENEYALSLNADVVKSFRAADSDLFPHCFVPGRCEGRAVGITGFAPASTVKKDRG